MEIYVFVVFELEETTRPVIECQNEAGSYTRLIENCLMISTFCSSSDLHIALTS